MNWNNMRIEQRRILLMLADLWDLATYATPKWEELPKHIQTDLEQVWEDYAMKYRAIFELLDWVEVAATDRAMNLTYDARVALRRSVVKACEELRSNRGEEA